MAAVLRGEEGLAARARSRIEDEREDDDALGSAPAAVQSAADEAMSPRTRQCHKMDRSLAHVERPFAFGRTRMPLEVHVLSRSDPDVEAAVAESELPTPRPDVDPRTYEVFEQRAGEVREAHEGTPRTNTQTECEACVASIPIDLGVG